MNTKDPNVGGDGDLGEELELLLIEWESGSLDRAGIDRVREILRSDPQARRQFLRSQGLTAALHLEQTARMGLGDLGALPTSSVMQPAVRVSRHGRSQVWFWLAAVAASLACLLGGRLISIELDRRHDATADRVPVEGYPGTDESETTSSGVALVTRLVDVDWKDGDLSHEVGDALSPGRFAFQSGLVQIEFFCGATVIVEGPAELDIESSLSARVHRGRLRAQVPPAARGFTVDAADMKIVDLGTEFGLAVSEEGANVQVFDGEVELHGPQAEATLLTAGQAVVRNSGGVIRRASADSADFVDIGTLESRRRSQQDARFDRWREHSGELRSDPRVIVYYPMDQVGGWQRRLQSSVVPRNEMGDGAIVGARRTRGRWDAKDALEFRRPADRVRLDITGEYQSLTLTCWAKIDSLDRKFNSLFLTDHYDLGEPHWQILESGQLYFSIRAGDRGQTGTGDRKVLSPPFWNPSFSGRWVHLATTFDHGDGRVVHYLDGEPIHSEVIPRGLISPVTRIGAASIGNWASPTRPDDSFAIRNLNGSIDELAVFSEPLAASEIKRMYELGKP